MEIDEEESPQAVDRANAWILETQSDRTWEDIYQGWRRGYLHFLTLLKEVPESDLRPDGKLAWMAEYQPLEGHPDVYDYHHAEHRILLETWMIKPAAE